MSNFQEWPLVRRQALFVDCIDKWGEAAQVDMLVEELAECVVAVQKYFKRSKTPETLDHMAEEMADALFMMEEIIYLMDMKMQGDFTPMVQSQWAFKLGRTRDRVNA